MNFRRPLILASNSPRRQYLMRELGYQFSIRKPSGDESFPEALPPRDVPAYLAEKKIKSFNPTGDEIVLTADTVVIIDSTILNKPVDRNNAIEMLSRLSGKTHTVITAFCIKDCQTIRSDFDETKVTFRALTQIEIQNYVDQFQPYDKAGAYGAQDCLPKGLTPCSQVEIEFLKKVNKPGLTEQTFTSKSAGTAMSAISKIEGSYFNVMGLPIHKVFNHLESF